jgi:hypothetical protein
LGIIAPIQMPGAPTLRIFRTSTNTFVVAWPSASGTYSLQQSSTIENPNWGSVLTTPQLVGDENQVIIPLNPGNKFFRLKLQ